MSASIDMKPHIEGATRRSIPMPVLAGSGVAIVLGLAGFGYAAATGQWNWAWGAYLVGLVTTMGLSMGGVMFAVVATMTKAHWSRPIKRVAESFGFFLPVSWLLLVVYLIGGLGLYVWNPNTFIAGGPVALEVHSPLALETKPLWLNPTFFMARAALGSLLLFGMGGAYIFLSLRPDLMRARQHLGDKAPSWWASIAGTGTDWKGTAERNDKIMQGLGIFLGLGYATIFSMLAFDLLMSLSPWWYTNMFGAWFFASCFWTAMAFLGIYLLLAKEWLGIESLVTKAVTHDLGKMVFAFTMFWAYTTFAQLLPIWYGQLPEETDYLLVRLFPLTDTIPAGDMPWYWLSGVVGALCFLIPFTVLLSRGIKKMKWPLISIFAVILVGNFLERSLLVYPSVHLEKSFPVLNLLLIGAPVWVGFFGAFVLVVTAVLSKLPAVPVSDPKMEPHPWDEHVHSLDAHHGHAHH
jgi:hypothetical protein